MPVNPLVANNPAQIQAVGSIMEALPGSLPFIVFGPYVSPYIFTHHTKITQQPWNRENCHHCRGDQATPEKRSKSQGSRLCSFELSGGHYRPQVT